MPKPGFSAKLRDESGSVLNVSVHINNFPPLRSTSVWKTEEDEKRNRHYFYNCIRPFLLFGSLIGVIPLEGLQQTNYQLLSFRKTSVRALISILIMTSLLFCIGIAVACLFVINNQNVTELVWASNPIIFFGMGFFGYAYMYRNNERFRQILHKWQSSPVSFDNEDKGLKRDASLIFGLFFSSAILENLLQQSIQLSLFDWLKSRMNGTVTGVSPLEAYFHATKQPNWKGLFPYHPVISVLQFIWNKCALYSWNFTDVFLIIFGRALYFQFKAILRHTERLAVESNNAITNKKAGDDGSSEDANGLNKWQAVSKDFETLISLLDDVKKFLSPMVFVSYAVNLFFTIIHLHMGLTPVDKNQDSAATELYRTWSFLQLLCRLYFVTLFAARINEYAEEFVELYRQCPSAYYCSKVERVERSARAMKIGLTGMNCFVVTKPFMLSLVSVVLTFEIVLLQTSGFSYF